MRKEAFDSGMTLLENALQGEFLPGFVGVIEDKLEEVDDESWSEIVEWLLRSAKKPREMTLADFLRAWTETRVRRQQMLKLEEAARFPRSESGCPKTLREIVAGMAVAGGNRWVQELHESLERRARDSQVEDSTSQGNREMVRLRFPQRYKEALERMGPEPQPEPPGQPPPPVVETW